jgi:hypothetical protein
LTNAGKRSYLVATWEYCGEPSEFFFSAACGDFELRRVQCDCAARFDRAQSPAASKARFILVQQEPAPSRTAFGACIRAVLAQVAMMAAPACATLSGALSNGGDKIRS